MTSPARPSRRRRLIGLLLVWLVCALIMTLVRLGSAWVVHGGPPDWAESVTGGVVIGLGVALVTWSMPSFPGGATAEKATQRAIARGTLPEDVDGAAVRAGLLHVGRLVTLGRRWGVLVFAVLTVAVAWLAVATDLDGIGLAVAGLCAVGVAVSAWWPTRQLRRVDRLLAELDAREAVRGVDRPVP